MTAMEAEFLHFAVKYEKIFIVFFSQPEERRHIEGDVEGNGNVR
jgi:hypothetical protein